jgi:putative Mg2+ transporter-C (MgtC) family protein
MPMPDLLGSYWNHGELATNIVILLNLAGALLLGLMVGYERSYHGRAAGMRTYGLVCMASAALTIVGGYPEFWFGGHNAHLLANTNVMPDPTRVIQGIVTGIGFLGAGVIMREGFNISGLTTAASIWSASAIGILVGVGFYMAAIGLAVMSTGIMIYLSKLEAWLPSRHAVAITMKFKRDFVPQRGGAARHGARTRLRDRRRFAHHRQRERRAGMALRGAGAVQAQRRAAGHACRRDFQIRRHRELPDLACAQLGAGP